MKYIRNVIDFHFAISFKCYFSSFLNVSWKTNAFNFANTCQICPFSIPSRLEPGRDGHGPGQRDLHQLPRRAGLRAATAGLRARKEEGGGGGVKALEAKEL